MTSLLIQKPLRIAIVAGEASGDALGASLIYALKDALPHAHFYGIAGPKMKQAGCEAWFDMHDLAVMGFVNVLAKLPKILKIRRQLTQQLLTSPPDLFIGIDAPDFNLPLEVKLKKANIPVIHYVSPTIWAWRPGRIKQIAKGVDLMLTLFPFEVDIYQQQGIAALCVSHPLASELTHVDMTEARSKLAIPQLAKVIALLPGSRQQELAYIAQPMLKACLLLQAKIPEVCFVAPMVNDKLYQTFLTYVKQFAPTLSMKVIQGQSDLALAAADCGIIKSGTSTLQAMLLSLPQVVVFKVNKLNELIVRCLVKTPFAAFPNILAGQEIVPELLQQKAKPEIIADHIFALLTDKKSVAKQQQAYQQAAKGLQGDVNVLARDAVLGLLSLLS